MRISDWSSDVCSSDLHVDAGVLPLHRPRLPHDADAELLGLQALGERLVGRVDAGAGLAALQQQLLARLQVVDRATGGEGGGDQSVLVLNVDDAELAARSEEHTSELQSLMRISYAVFCVKKTK